MDLLHEVCDSNVNKRYSPLLFKDWTLIIYSSLKAYPFSFFFLVHLALSFILETVQGRDEICHLFFQSVGNDVFLISSLIDNSQNTFFYTLKSIETARLHSKSLSLMQNHVYWTRKYEPDTIPNTLCVLAHITLLTTLWDRYCCYPHDTNEATYDQRG